MTTDLDKLRVLLPHWLEHNTEHAGEFRSWADRARTAGDERLAEYVEAAALKIEAAKHDLEDAIAHLGGQVDHHYHSPHHHDHIDH